METMKRRRDIYMRDGGPGRQYIGQAVNLKKRQAGHRSDCKRGVDCSLYNAVRKHPQGWDGFPLRVLASGWWTDEQANDAEEGYIAYHDTFRNGLNETKGGGGSTGRVPTQEQRAKQSAKLLGRKPSEQERRNMSAAQKNKTLTQEHRDKIGAAHLGMKRSAKARENMRRAQKNKPPVSQETRDNMSAARKGVPKSEAHKAAMREAWVRRKERQFLLSGQTQIPL